MRIPLCFLVTTLAIVAPSTGGAQTRKSAPVMPRRDTLAVALVSTDTVAAGQVETVVRARHREVQFCFEETGLKTDPELSSAEEVIKESDVLILCTPHKAFKSLDLRGKPMIDVWKFWS